MSTAKLDWIGYLNLTIETRTSLDHEVSSKETKVRRPFPFFFHFFFFQREVSPVQRGNFC